MTRRKEEAYLRQAQMIHWGRRYPVRFVAQLVIYGISVQMVYEGVTDANGMLSYLVTEPGAYTVRELEAPEGYAITDEVWTFTVHSDGSVTGTTSIPNTALTDIPKTGGNALRLMLLISVLGCTGGSVGALVYYRRKKGK